MSKQYCLDIINKTNVPINSEKLKEFVQNLYASYFEEEKVPFFTIYTKTDNNVCIVLTSRSKKNIQKIEEINESLSDSDLKFGKIQLSKPFLYEVEPEKWIENKDEIVLVQKGEKRWDSLKHNGPYFTHIMEPYEPIGASLIYDGKEYSLTPKEERIAGFYAKRIISEEAGNVVEELTKDSVFNKNFWGDFVDYLTPEHKKIFKDFKKIDWTNIVKLIKEIKETGVSEEEKLRKKVKTEEKKKEYAFAYRDGIKEKLGNYTVEPSAIFYGRGANPMRGKIKKEVDPEDVIINVGENDPIPAPPKGHKWGGIVHEHTAVWVAKWKDSLTNSNKYVYFSMESKFKGESDMAKYEHARKLNKYIDEVREIYTADAMGDNMRKKQLGTVLYLIDSFGIRVGNEKEKDETDTVGATTLRVGNVELSPPNHIILDFLGKDSVRFYKDLEVPEFIYENIELFIDGRGEDEDIFNKISADDVNEYLKQFDRSFTAKVFRTRLASTIMYDALAELKIPVGSTKAKTKMLFNKANAQVAEVLNHTRNVSKKAKQSMEKIEGKLEELYEELELAKANKKSIASIEKKIETAKTRLEAKGDVINIAITTSLNNYIDPRMIVAWCKVNEIDPSAIYTSAMMKKFNWAINSTEEDWDYYNTPLIGSQDLEPAEKGKEIIGKEVKEVSSKITSKVSKIKPKSEKVDKTVKKINMEIIKYTDKSIVVIGDTKDYKEELKNMGGKWNNMLKNKETGEVFSGWIFTTKKQEIVQNFIDSVMGNKTNDLENKLENNLKILLKICNNPTESNKKLLSNIETSILEWLYPFIEYGFNHSDELDNFNSKFAEYIVDELENRKM